MKAAFYFAMREIRRRPRHFLATTIVSAAILMTLIMNVMQMSAEWRNDVMPEKPSNYHFTVKGLTEDEKRWIRSQPWVQVCYDVERYINKGQKVNDTLNVRVIMSENNRALRYAREVFDKFDLWSSPDYASRYQSYVDDNIGNLKYSYKTDNLNFPVDRGETLLDRARSMAKGSLISLNIRNKSYCDKVTNSYIIRPEFFVLSNMLACFLGGVMMILQSENYRSLMPEYGTLRSFGLRKEQLFFINGFESLASSLAAIPLGAVISVIVVEIYLRVNKDALANDSVYLKITENVPISIILIMSLLLTVTSLIGTLLVCLYYRKRSTMELLKKEGSVQVSFVAKTSPRFEKAKSPRIYSSLQIRRTRMSFFLLALIIAIMMPLPLNLMGTAFFTLFRGDTLSPETIAELYYYIFQAVVMFITSIIVIYVAARARTDDRHGEFAILRAIGMNKAMIRKTAFRSVIWQIMITVIPAVAFFAYVTDQTLFMSSSAVRDPRNLTMGKFLGNFSANALGIILLIAPAMLLATAFSLIRFNRRSIIESIRENE